MSAADSGWVAGAAVSPFPIADGTLLTGYEAREGPAEGTLDPLTVGALVLERGGERLVIVAADLAAVDAELVPEIANAAGIARSQLALCASHTHSGPAGVVARLHPASPNELDPALRTRFVATAAETIAAARRDLQAVALLFGMAEVTGIAANRNAPTITSDERLSVLATRRGDGSLHCAVVHVACHPTILGAGSRVVSADFPGALRRRLANLLSQGDNAPIVLFVNGAAGNLSTRFTRRAQDAAEVERMGGLLAEAASDAVRGARPLGGSLRHAATSVALQPRMSVIPRNEESRHDANKRSPKPRSLLRRDDIGGSGRSSIASSAGLRRIAETRVQGLAMLAALSALPDGAIATRCHLDAWALGGLTLVSVPGELFASFGHQIATSAIPTLVLGYTNGYIGYLADRRAFEAGTYEALASPYGPEDGERVATAAEALAADLRSASDVSSTSA